MTSFEREQGKVGSQNKSCIPTKPTIVVRMVSLLTVQSNFFERPYLHVIKYLKFIFNKFQPFIFY